MPHGSALSLFRKMNYFKKLPEDLTISTTPGSILTLVGAVAMALLFVLELNAFLSLKLETSIEIDDTIDTMMRINFNVTVDDAPCEYLSVDLTDVTGTYEHNVTRHISKVRLSQWRRWIALHPDEGAGMPAYIQPTAEELAQIAAERAGVGAALAAALAAGADPAVAAAEADGAKALDVHGNPVGEVVALSERSTAAYVQTHEMVFVNFFAPWSAPPRAAPRACHAPRRAACAAPRAARAFLGGEPPRLAVRTRGRAVPCERRRRRAPPGWRGACASCGQARAHSLPRLICAAPPAHRRPLPPVAGRCHWCRELEPIWAQAAAKLPELHYGERVKVRPARLCAWPALLRSAALGSARERGNGWAKRGELMA